MNIELSTLKSGCIGYKMTSFKDWSAATYQAHATNTKNWSGLYIAEKEETAKGYAPDMVGDSGNGTVYLQSVSVLQDVNLITCLDESFKTGDIDMKALKKALRDKSIAVEDEDLLMIKLGTLGYAFRCYNNEEGAIEIIFPNAMAELVGMQLDKTCTVKNYELQACK